MSYWLLVPPIAFLVVLAFVWLQGVGFRALAFKNEGPQPAGKFKAYACGEDVKDHRAQPDYGQFFHYAFFFTIMHVVALVIATIPAHSVTAALLGGFYLLAATVGLFVLFRR